MATAGLYHRWFVGDGRAKCEQLGYLLAIGDKCTKQSQCDWHSQRGLGGMANQEAGGEDLQKEMVSRDDVQGKG